jgi:hypothetical protein
MATEAHETNNQATDAEVDNAQVSVQASDAQKALFNVWATGSDFNLDIYDSPKRQFNILAKLLNWEGGEEPWNTHWQECFGEEYIWHGNSMYKHSTIRQC